MSRVHILVLPVAIAAGTSLLGLASDAAAQEMDIEPARRVEVDAEIDALYPRFAHPTFKVETFGGLRGLFDVAIGVAGVDIAAGVDTRRGSFYANLGGAGGQTDGGLPFGQFVFGPDLEWNVDFLRLGLHPRVSYVTIGRITQSDSFELLGIGGGVALGFDVYRREGVVVSLGLEPKAEWVTAPLPFTDSQDTVLWGGNAFLQVRLRAPRHPRPRR